MRSSARGSGGGRSGFRRGRNLTQTRPYCAHIDGLGLFDLLSSNGSAPTRGACLLQRALFGGGGGHEAPPRAFQRMMERRTFLMRLTGALLAGSLLAGSLASPGAAQGQAGKIWRLGLLRE